MWKIIGAILMVASAALIVSPAFVRTAQGGAHLFLLGFLLAPVGLIFFDCRNIFRQNPSSVGRSDYASGLRINTCNYKDAWRT